MMKLLLFIFGLLTLGSQLRGEFPELDFCPEECDCHYFRVNYVTDCSESNFTEIPYEEISPDVYILDFNGNEIANIESFPEDFKVRRLQLAENKLTAITEYMFSGLKVLLDIDLSGNLIETIDRNAFRDSPGLITVELQNNPLRHVSTGPLLICKSLLYLDVSGCGLRNLNHDVFSEVPFLTTLLMSNNPLKNITHQLFSHLVTLEELRLRNCSLSFLSPDSFQNLIHLKLLDLSQNAFTNVDWVSVFGGLTRLEHLNLEASGVRNLPDDVFANNTWLRFLDLSDNHLSDLDLGTTLGANLRNLHHLDLSNCSLSSLDETSFQSARKLKTLHLSHNRLLPKELKIAVTLLKTITTLELRNCSLTKIPKDIFEEMSDLRELDISWNPLSDVFVELLQPLQNLEFLNMGYSNLARLSKDTFSKTTNLRRLVLSGNKLGDLEAGLLKNLTRLEVLELNQCGLKNALDDDVFLNKTYTELKELYMSGNPIKVDAGPFIPEQLSKLRTLDLSYCSIRQIPEDAFSTITNLTRLVLHSNFLTHDAFLKTLPLKNLSNLEYLDLSNNNFTTLPVTVISGTTMKYIKLTNNPWVCDCSLADWWNWARKQGDVSHLIGAALTQEDIMKGGNKKKRPLLCSFDGKTQRRNITSKRIRLETGVKTWARYLKESTCQLAPLIMAKPTTVSTPVFFPEPILPSPSLVDTKMEQLKLVADGWDKSPTIHYVAGGFFVLGLFLVLGILLNQRFYNARKMSEMRKSHEMVVSYNS